MPPDSSSGMRTSLIGRRGTYKCILKFRFPQIAILYKENVQKTHLLLLLLVPRAPDSSRGMRTSLVVSRGTYKCILKFRLKLYLNRIPSNCNTVQIKCSKNTFVVVIVSS